MTIRKYLTIVLVLCTSILKAQCVAEFNYYSGTANNGDIDFIATNTFTSNMQFTWTVNNSIQNINNPNFTYVFPENGVYNVCLNIYDSQNNCNDDTCVAVSVTTAGFCLASFSHMYDANNTLILTSQEVNSLNTTYNWDLGNGQTANGKSVNAVYSISGNYNVCLTVANPISNCSQTICDTLYNIGLPTPCSADFIYSFDSNGILLCKAIDSFSTNMFYWHQGSNTVVYGPNLMTTYPVTSPFNLCLSSLSGNGCTDTVCKLILPPPNSICNANYYIYPDTSGAPHSYIGINTSTGTGLSYSWNWGDGSTSTGQYPSHTYASAGNYVITLIVDNGAGCIDTFSAPQTINKTATMYSVSFGTPTSVNSISKTIATIYPNPTKDNFTIKGLATTKYQVEIMNLNGSILKSVSANGNQAINISSLANNIYILKITNQDGTTQFAKLIKE